MSLQRYYYIPSGYIRNRTKWLTNVNKMQKLDILPPLFAMDRVSQQSKETEEKTYISYHIYTIYDIIKYI